ncbi:hypothetical protein BJ875DRAFT_546483 [Amylocarpus encephaloides]|uniref:Uncharacterized protein n=1 Tax=Amylocarpus encephaloides TaxID=45428 RepID=A0A9P7YAG1_9HELO|nr:hypothetical protein BJ875DRAFT_546483 [Amylocarpus encephaloides]
MGHRTMMPGRPGKYHVMSTNNLTLISCPTQTNLTIPGKQGLAGRSIPVGYCPLLHIHADGGIMLGAGRGGGLLKYLMQIMAQAPGLPDPLAREFIKPHLRTSHISKFRREKNGGGRGEGGSMSRRIRTEGHEIRPRFHIGGKEPGSYRETSRTPPWCLLPWRWPLRLHE